MVVADGPNTVAQLVDTQHAPIAFDWLRRDAE
jgi:hypothetical protein